MTHKVYGPLKVDGDIISDDGIVVDGASNLAGDEGVYSSKSGSTLQLKSLTAGSGINLSSDTNAITIDTTGGGGGGFYGVIFKESESGGAVFRDDTLVVDSDNFYLSSDGSGKPILGFLGITSSQLPDAIAYSNTELNGNTKDLTMDWDEGNIFFLPIRRPMTIHTPTNLPSNSQVVNLVTQNDGFYSFIWSSKYIFPGGGQQYPTQGTGRIDLWSMIYMPTIDRILVTKAADLFY